MTDDQTNIVVPVGPNLEVPVMRWDEFMPAGRWSWPAELADWTHAYVRVVHDGAPIVIDAELLPSWSGSRPDELAIPDPRDIPFYSPDWEPLLTPHRYTWLIDVMRETDSELRVLSAEEHL